MNCPGGACGGHSTLPVAIADAIAAGGGGSQMIRRLADDSYLVTEFEIHADGTLTCSPGHVPWVVDGAVYGLCGR